MTCLAFAWSSPLLVMVDIDRTKYRPVILTDTKSRKDLELVLAAEDPRKVVVLMEGVAVLARVADLPCSFIVFDDHLALQSVTGAIVLDYDDTSDIKRKKVTIDTVHQYLEAPPIPFTVPSNLVKVSTELAKKITLRDLVTKVRKRGGSPVTDEFITRTCERIVGRIRKATWTAKVCKPALLAGMDAQVLAELERFLDDSSVSEGLWRGFYDFVELGKDITAIEKQYDIRVDDLKFLTDTLGAESVGEDAYVTSPAKSKKKAKG